MIFQVPKLKTLRTDKPKEALFFFWSWGSVEWQNPTFFNFGDTGLFTIGLQDATFGTPGSANIFASLTFIQADTPSTPTPEPSTMLLMGTGLLGFVAYGRWRFNKKA